MEDIAPELQLIASVRLLPEVHCALGIDVETLTESHPDMCEWWTLQAEDLQGTDLEAEYIEALLTDTEVLNLEFRRYIANFLLDNLVGDMSILSKVATRDYAATKRAVVTAVHESDVVVISYEYYVVKDVGIIEASEEACVMYEALYDSLKGLTWVRTVDNFLEEVEKDGQTFRRFSPVT